MTTLLVSFMLQESSITRLENNCTTGITHDDHKLQQSYNKMICFDQLKFITKDSIVKHTNITTKLKIKAFTKVIKMPS